MPAVLRERSILDLCKRIPAGLKVRARNIYLKTQVLSRGAKYRCPVCENRLAFFNPLPEFLLENQTAHGFPFSPDEAETCNDRDYDCPFCHASDRDRLYALYLRDRLLKLESGASMVDFGPSGPLTVFIRRLIDQAGLNISYRTADLFNENADDRVDLADLNSYRDGQFDLFICSHVLEHVPDDQTAMRELCRILGAGGHGIVMVPIILTIDEIDEDPTLTDEGERWRRFGQFDHVRLYSKRGFVERLKEAKFLVHELGADFFGPDLFAASGITNQSVLYVVEKRSEDIRESTDESG